ncbi:MAG: hypothetical protein EA365_14115 [Gloeocapsa sp. DLM2.Bin57]|nr:MAG: hypothetical protein EA365_14115 [Gloeocapsa sp. DLM2.Bin57]
MFSWRRAILVSLGATITNFTLAGNTLAQDSTVNPVPVPIPPPSINLSDTIPNVGYFTDGNPGTTGPVSAINIAGFNPVQITDISTFNLNTIDMLMVNNSSSRGGFSTALLNRLPSIETWVSNGGSFIAHDRFVSSSVGLSESNPLLLGTPTTLTQRDLGSDLDIIAPGDTLVTNGPHGVLNDSSLDGGDWSSHGFVIGKKKKKSRGGQKGHIGKSRELYPESECRSIENHVPATCKCCGEELSGTVSNPYRHQVVEIPPRELEIVEHRLHELECKHCGAKTRANLPENITESGYGATVVTLVSLMSGVYRYSHRMIVRTIIILRRYCGV